ncbi:D-alanyl-D-alanine carboxypeptidase (DD-carboxypeptidase) (DD-peptidase) [Durusdinium trenchii]|uniref:D-alanyl-D-alanine carboxypeptidase (DD-carboxypeptidase) (DD-peptidase) n=1 Tax=Durusdinium trenchii TaxID=1381693 RepID=A0ABP0JGT1_9DINO
MHKTLCSLSAVALTPACWAQCDFGAADALAAAIVDDFPLVSGASLRLEDPLLPGPSLERFYGDYDRGTVVPIASATKLLSAIVVMSCVEQDGLDLDAPVATYLPEFGGTKGTMTVRQMFSHTSGLPSNSVFAFDPSITLAQAVTRIALFTPLEATPGTDFCYGQVSMHVAGRVCEVVSGTDWDTLFAERVAMPLGLTDTNYDGLYETTNPLIAGGAESSLEDYSRVIRMLIDGGMYRGERIIEQSSINAMFTDLTAGLPIRCTPASRDTQNYGLGAWVLTRADGSRRVDSPGAFAYTPWVELDDAGNPLLGGVYMIEDGVSSLSDPIDAARLHAVRGRHRR